MKLLSPEQSSFELCLWFVLGIVFEILLQSKK